VAGNERYYFEKNLIKRVMTITLNKEFRELGQSGSTPWYELVARVISDEENEIQEVEYFFDDPSISTPFRLSGNANDNFKVEAQSWRADLPVTATIRFKDIGMAPVTLTSDNPVVINNG
jgi:hypothetical protein